MVLSEFQNNQCSQRNPVSKKPHIHKVLHLCACTHGCGNMRIVLLSFRLVGPGDLTQTVSLANCGFFVDIYSHKTCKSWIYLLFITEDFQRLIVPGLTDLCLFTSLLIAFYHHIIDTRQSFISASQVKKVGVFVALFIVVTKSNLTRSNLQEEGFTATCSWRTYLPSQQPEWEAASHIQYWYSASFPLTQLRISTHGMVQLTFRVGRPSSMIKPRNPLTRKSRAISELILHLIKLTTGINHHTRSQLPHEGGRAGWGFT